jgi:hypothetical protein
MSETVLADFRLPRALRRVVAAMARVALTDEVERLGLTDAVVDHVELSLRSIPFHLRTGVVAGLTSFEAGALALPSSFGRTFSRLPRAKQ